jgi:hypothetical protein
MWRSGDSRKSAVNALNYMRLPREVAACGVDMLDNALI